MKAKSLEEIMSVEGIVVRQIPKNTRKFYVYSKGMSVKNGKIVDANGKKYIEVTTENQLYGYAVTIQKDQTSSVRFSKVYSGYGDTIQSAYSDYIVKSDKLKSTLSKLDTGQVIGCENV